jgi:hypothetical protein
MILGPPLLIALVMNLPPSQGGAVQCVFTSNRKPPPQQGGANPLEGVVPENRDNIEINSNIKSA